MPLFYNHSHLLSTKVIFKALDWISALSWFHSWAEESSQGYVCIAWRSSEDTIRLLLRILWSCLQQGHKVRLFMDTQDGVFFIFLWYSTEIWPHCKGVSAPCPNISHTKALLEPCFFSYLQRNKDFIFWGTYSGLPSNNGDLNSGAGGHWDQYSKVDVLIEP